GRRANSHSCRANFAVGCAKSHGRCANYDVRRANYSGVVRNLEVGARIDPFGHMVSSHESVKISQKFDANALYVSALLFLENCFHPTKNTVMSYNSTCIAPKTFLIL